MNRVASSLLCVAVALVSCGTQPQTAPRPEEGQLPHGAVKLKRPDFYTAWWKDVERCSGKTARLKDVRFYIAFPAGNSFAWGDTRVHGLAYPQRNAIVLASEWVFDAGLVRHEMLHLIASPNQHDSTYFRGKCRGVVVCFGPCLGES